MKPAVIVLLLVARGDMQQPTTAALTRAAETVLGPGSHILLHEQPKALTDEEAIALADQMRASMVVAVTWSNDRMRAHVHVHFSERPGWLERDVAFMASDPPNERGRTLGFEIATMVPDLPPAQPALVSPSPSAVVPPRPEERPVAPEANLRRWALDLGGVAAFGGDATGYGMAADVRWSIMGASQPDRTGFSGPLFVRAGGALRFGRVLAADATAITLVPALGAGFTVAAGDRVRVGLRADALAILTELSRSSPAETRGRWVPGVDVAGEIELAVSPIAFAAAAGGEYALGDTVVRVGASDAATVPRLRFVSELGVRWRF